MNNNNERMDLSRFEYMMSVDGLNTISNYMDDDIREAVHMDVAPCTDVEFLAEYCRRHVAKYGEEFNVN